MMGASDFLWSPDGKKMMFNKKSSHFASRDKVDYLNSVLNYLPDPDVILRKRGIGLEAYKDLLVDDHLSSVWDTRISSVSSSDWEITPASDSKEDIKIFEFCKEIFDRKDFDVFAKMEEMMEAVAYGFKPFEYLWTKDGQYWTVDDFVGKPADWFAFSPDKKLMLKSGYKLEDVPEGRFQVFSNRATYDNPYGVKLFSRCYWPVVFKSQGWNWFTMFVEKYASLFLIGKVPENAKPGDDNKLLDALDAIVSNGITVVNEGTHIDKLEAGNKSSSADVYDRYILMNEKAMSKAILGQTLTTDTSGSTGTYAAGKVHAEVREDRAKRDRRLIAKAWNDFFRNIVFYNFGDCSHAPSFSFKKAENLNTDRVDRDQKLFVMGVVPTKKYIEKNYGFEEDDFDIKDTNENKASFKKVAKVVDTFSQETEEDDLEETNPNFFKEQDFANKQLKKALKVQQRFVKDLFASIKKAKSYDEAYRAMVEKYEKKNQLELVMPILNLRYVSSSLGGKE